MKIFDNEVKIVDALCAVKTLKMILNISENALKRACCLGEHWLWRQCRFRIRVLLSNVRVSGNGLLQIIRASEV